MAAGDGLVTMTPTSIAHSGTSATINADGSVDFSAVTSLSLNGVFTSSFDNYLINVRLNVSTDDNIYIRYRASGTDATATNYTRQYLAVGGTLKVGERITSASVAGITYASSASNNGVAVHVYGPYLAQPTASRSVTTSGYLNAFMQDEATTHSLSTSYDGFTIFPATGALTITGNIAVFGYEE